VWFVEASGALRAAIDGGSCAALSAYAFSIASIDEIRPRKVLKVTNSQKSGLRPQDSPWKSQELRLLFKGIKCMMYLSVIVWTCWGNNMK
jgi:hypothetical protein